MATSLIASWGTIATANSSSVQRKLFFDGTRWWAFYLKSTDRTRLYYAYSTDLAAWTETSVSINNGLATEGGAETVDVLWDAATSQVLISYQGYTAYRGYTYIRGSLSGTTISWGVNTLYIDSAGGGKNASSDWQFSWAKGSDGKILGWHANASGNFVAGKSTNALSSVFADTAADWTNTVVPGTVGYPKKDAAYSLAAGKYTALGVDGYNIKAHVYDGATWTNYQALALFSGDYYSWGSAFVSDTSIWVLARTATSALALYQATTGGATWSAKTAPTWPTGGLATNSQVALATDGTDLWAVVIRGDANKSVSYNKYTVSGNSWGGWTDLETGAATRQYIAATIANSLLVATWSQVNGSNYDAYNATLSLGAVSWDHTGTAVTLSGSAALGVATGSRAISGTVAALAGSAVLGTATGTAALASTDRTGTATTLAATAAIGTAAGTRAASGTAVTLAASSSLGTADGTRAVSGTAADLTGTAALSTATGTAATVEARSGTATDLSATGALSAATGTKAVAAGAQALTGAAALDLLGGSPQRYGAAIDLTAAGLLSPAIGYNDAGPVDAAVLASVKHVWRRRSWRWPSPS